MLCLIKNVNFFNLQILHNPLQFLIYFILFLFFECTVRYSSTPLSIHIWCYHFINCTPENTRWAYQSPSHWISQAANCSISPKHTRCFFSKYIWTNDRYLRITNLILITVPDQGSFAVQIHTKKKTIFLIRPYPSGVKGCYCNNDFSSRQLILKSY